MSEAFINDPEVNQFLIKGLAPFTQYLVSKGWHWRENLEKNVYCDPRLDSKFAIQQALDLPLKLLSWQMKEVNKSQQLFI